MTITSVIESIQSLSYIYNFETEDAILQTVNGIEKMFIMLKGLNTNFEVSVTLKESKFRLATLMSYDTYNKDSNQVFVETLTLDKYWDLIERQLEHDY